MIKLFGQSQILKKDETLDVFRETKSAVYKDGKSEAPCVLEFQVVCNVQPVNGRDLLIVPEGDRFKEQYWLYMNNDCIVREEGLEIQDVNKLFVSDRVKRLGVNFQVQTVEDWGSYIRARIMRTDVGPDATP